MHAAHTEELYKQFLKIHEPIDRYLWLRELHDKDVDGYHRLLMMHTEIVLPFIYTPVVGEACQRYHKLGIKTRGLYISLNDRGHILEKLKTWPQLVVRVIVVTDGERILGLGDLGTGGMGISEGKITLYTVAAGVDPAVCLPMCLDVGTDNQALLDDPQYPGLRRKRARGEEYDTFLDELVQAICTWQPHLLLQFEDFGNTNAFRLLDRYQGQLCCFNDDIQGTAAITLAALLSAGNAAGIPLHQQKVLFLGAGEAGTGIGELIAYCIHRRTGCSIKEARQRCYFMDSQGLVCASRTNLAHHKQDWAHDVPHVKPLLQAVQELRPTALIGVSAQGGAFTEDVVRAMADFNARPIIFPLSNPTTMSECTFEQALKWTDGRVLFASGSPFDPQPAAPLPRKSSISSSRSSNSGALSPVASSGLASPQLSARTSGSGALAPPRIVYPAQANNAYIFPALGLAVVLTSASRITQEAFLVAAEALAELAQPERVLHEGVLFPSFSYIMDVSAHVAARLAQHLVTSGAGVRPAGLESDKSDVWLRFVKSQMWHVKVGAKHHNAPAQKSPRGSQDGSRVPASGGGQAGARLQGPGSPAANSNGHAAAALGGRAGSSKM